MFYSRGYNVVHTANYCGLDSSVFQLRGPGGGVPFTYPVQTIPKSNTAPHKMGTTAR